MNSKGVFEERDVKASYRDVPLFERFACACSSGLRVCVRAGCVCGDRAVGPAFSYVVHSSPVSL